MYLIDIQCGSFVLCILLLLLESRSSMTTLFILRNSFCRNSYRCTTTLASSMYGACHQRLRKHHN